MPSKTTTAAWKINVEFVHTLKLLMPEHEEINLILVGCGGTGSWLAPAVARVAKLLIERGKDVKLAFVDPDKVEEKNIYRQNFCQAEIGMNKAEALAARYGQAWGLEIVSKPVNVQGSSHCHGVIIGCVDNAEARKWIAEIKRSWWLDCGNTKNYGQVLLGGGDPDNAFNIPGCCGWLPSPALIHPELIKRSIEHKEKSALGTRIRKDLSCAEMALQDAQGLSINQRMAAEGADYLVRILITKDLRKYATYIDLESGTCRSEYIVKETIEKLMPPKITREIDRFQAGCPQNIPGVEDADDFDDEEEDDE